MAFPTLGEIREDWLNDALGLLSDDDPSFGTTVQRNNYIREAIARLWPTVGKLLSENVTPSATAGEYALTSVHTPQFLDELDSDGIVRGELRSWKVVVIESTDPPTRRIRLSPVGRLDISAVSTVRVTGFVPFAVPANDDSSPTDIPSARASIVASGARVNAIRWKLSQFVNFERQANETRANSVSSPELLSLYQDAKRDWEQDRALWQREISAPRRAVPTVGR